MKTHQINTEYSIVEMAKRSFNSFQLLIIGVAIPFLFVIGISNFNQRKIQETPVKQNNEVQQQTSEQATGWLVKNI